MTTGYLGYITAFDGSTLHNGTTRKALTSVGAIVTANNHLFTLPNGTVVNYDGTSDSPTRLVEVEVDYWWTTNGQNLYDGVQARIGNRGTVTKTKFSTVSSGTETATGILLDISIDDEKSVPQKGQLYVTIKFGFASDWS